MENEPEEKRAGRSTVAYAVTAFALIYLLSPPLFLTPFYLFGTSGLPAWVNSIAGVYTAPAELLMGKIPAYDEFVQWQMRHIYIPMVR